LSTICVRSRRGSGKLLHARAEHPPVPRHLPERAGRDLGEVGIEHAVIDGGVDAEQCDRRRLQGELLRLVQRLDGRQREHDRPAAVRLAGHAVVARRDPRAGVRGSRVDHDVLLVDPADVLPRLLLLGIEGDVLVQHHLGFRLVAVRAGEAGREFFFGAFPLVDDGAERPFAVPEHGGDVAVAAALEEQLVDRRRHEAGDLVARAFEDEHRPGAGLQVERHFVKSAVPLAVEEHGADDVADGRELLPQLLDLRAVLRRRGQHHRPRFEREEPFRHEILLQPAGAAEGGRDRRLVVDAIDALLALAGARGGFAIGDGVLVRLVDQRLELVALDRRRLAPRLEAFDVGGRATRRFASHRRRR
jgi:hypothetical protein